MSDSEETDWSDWSKWTLQDAMTLLVDATQRLGALEILHHTREDRKGGCCCGIRECFVAAVLEVEIGELQEIMALQADAAAIQQRRADVN